MECEIKLGSKLILRNRVVFQPLLEEGVLLDTETGNCFGLDCVGVAIATILQQERTVREIVDRLLELYEVPRQLCESDVINFATRLRENGLLEVTPD